MRKLLATLTLLLSASQVFAQAKADAPPPLLIGRVAHHGEQIAFTCAGKIWLVPRAGGAARRLTSTPQDETAPVFSPDGRSLAFSRHNGGDWDVFVIAANGAGEARRVTLMPENDFVAAWTPDGAEVVFETTRDEEGVNRFYKMRVEGATLAEPLPLPQAVEGSFAPDGNSIAYTPRNPLVFGEWRYYRGGMAGAIWITNLRTGATEKLSNQNFNDRNPVWVGDKIYFTSDRTNTYNLFAYDRRTKQTEQLTRFDGQGIRSMSATADAVVFVQDGRLHVFDPATKQSRPLSVSVAPDTSELAPRNVNTLRFLEHILPSADGARIVIGARGDVFVFDAASGAYRNLTNTSGAAERYPALSPDGKQVAYFSDEGGEYALHLRALETNAVRKISIEPRPSFYWNLSWSPDAKRLIFTDRRLNLWLADTEAGTTTKLDTSDYSAQDDWATHFSPDSRFLAYARRLKNRAGTVFIYDTTQRKSFQLTDGKTHAESPVFDASGKYLYFTSSPNALTSEFEWASLSGMLARPLVVRRVHVVLLTKDATAPFLSNGQPNAEAKVSDAQPETRVDFEGIERRILNLPLPQRDYARLSAGRAGRIFLAVNEWGKTPGDSNWQGRTTTLYHYDLARAGEMQKIVESVSSIDVTPNGAKLLYGKDRNWFLIDAESAPKTDEGKLDLSKMEVKVNPGEEWRQIFHESVRLMRDWFYDPNHHGQDLAALENYYAAYLPTVTRRADLNALMGRMLGSVSVSHFNIGGGDAPAGGGGGGGGNRTGLLGADYAVEGGRFRFKRIYRTTSYASPAGSFSAPLDQPGVDVREGDYLIEVNGQKVEATKNLLAYFENTVGRPTKLVVSANADGSGARTFTVFPANGENRLRRANWAENNRRLVERMSGGRLGYIFIEGYGQQGILNAMNGLTGYSDRAGVVIDQRFNGGGITPDYLIEWLNRRPLYDYLFRGGEDLASPVNPAPPVKVLITNEWNGSAAETGALMFKLARTGQTVGKRTAGAGIGPYFFTPRFVDNGIVQIPNRAAYNPDGSSWGIENAGVEPDVDVEIMPADLLAGRDPQLERAVELALAQVTRTPRVAPKRPPFPVHPGKVAASTTTLSNSANLPLAGSAYPPPAPRAEVKPVVDGKFADYTGQFETQMGVLTFRQEGDKLIGIAGNGERIELAPDASAKDRFAASNASVQVTFERDAGGKVSGLTIIIPSGRELKGKKTN